MVTRTSPSYLQRIQSHLAADTWRKYCRFDVKHQTINQSIYFEKSILFLECRYDSTYKRTIYNHKAKNTYINDMEKIHVYIISSVPEVIYHTI